MLVDPQEIWRYCRYQPNANGGRTIEPSLNVNDPAYWLTKRIGSTFTFENRIWTVRQFYLPKVTTGNTVETGVRAMVVDDHGFVSFVNQRDLEVLLDIRRAGEWCAWLGAPYVGTKESEFYGCCCDEADAWDELHSYEMELRRQFPNGFIPGEQQRERWIHYGWCRDEYELWHFLWDAEPSTGISPDSRLETIESRWTRSHHEKWPEWRFQ